RRLRRTPNGLRRQARAPGPRANRRAPHRRAAANPHRRPQGGIKQMSTTETQTLPAGTWSGDRVHSTVGFAVEYMAGTFTGTFSDFDARVADGVVQGSAKVASI